LGVVGVFFFFSSVHILVGREDTKWRLGWDLVSLFCFLVFFLRNRYLGLYGGWGVDMISVGPLWFDYIVNGFGLLLLLHWNGTLRFEVLESVSIVVE
jgi:hypothetical protein